MTTGAEGKALRPRQGLVRLVLSMAVATWGTTSPGLATSDAGTAAVEAWSPATAPSAAAPAAWRLPPFHAVDELSQRKQRFLDYLLPLVRAENDRIRQQRLGLEEVAAAYERGRPLGERRWWYLRDLAREYRVDAAALGPGRLIEALRERVDVIPPSLALAQAAKESGWGGSRFARRGNNLFGQWCFERGCGLVPRERGRGREHEIRAFTTVRHSVASYLKNLNTHPGYRALRALRAHQRRLDLPLSGLLLAEGLTRYSEGGAGYVREVQTLIRQIGLEGDVVMAQASRG